MSAADPGFLPGVLVGGLLAAAALWLGLPPVLPGSESAVASPAARWLLLNLGGSVWAFGAVFALWAWHLSTLRRCLDVGSPGQDRSGRLVQLDQLSEVWAHLFVGIGVIWTAIGMRAALQTTLGDPDAALADTAGDVLRGLVDGGILLALTTTIVGAVGGYLMRLAKTLWVGVALHAHYEAEQSRELRDLLDATRRIESSIRGAERPQEAERTRSGSENAGGHAWLDHAAVRRLATAAAGCRTEGAKRSETTA
ncbi:MAG: hypothetical protein V2J24_20115 [Pseudomonadales bacterium]|jgi:hypothetical protein|nr:hypothetical protein [Pseudomonadales bacterium]